MRLRCDAFMTAAVLLGGSVGCGEANDSSEKDVDSTPTVGGGTEISVTVVGTIGLPTSQGVPSLSPLHQMISGDRSGRATVAWDVGGLVSVQPDSKFTSSRFNAINVNALAVGSADGKAIWWDGDFTKPLQALPLASDRQAVGSDVNRNSLIVGSSWLQTCTGTGGPSCPPSAVRWTPNYAGGYNSPQAVAMPPGTAQSTALGVNDSGKIVGQMVASTGGGAGFISNNGATAVPFRPTFAPSSSNVYPFDINAAGEVTGTVVFVEGTGRQKAFYRSATATAAYVDVGQRCAATLGETACYHSQAMALNDSGMVVGRYFNATAGGQTAFAYNAITDVFYRLNTLLPKGSTWNLKYAVSIDLEGRVLAVARDSTQATGTPDQLVLFVHPLLGNNTI